MPILAGNDYEKSFESKGHLIFKRYGNDIGTHSLGGIDSWNYFSSPEILKKSNSPICLIFKRVNFFLP